jgi:hypothetical protein
MNIKTRTWINSTGAESPEARVAVILVAGKAFGTTVMTLRLRGLEMTREDMDTATSGQP